MPFFEYSLLAPLISGTEVQIVAKQRESILYRTRLSFNPGDTNDCDVDIVLYV